MVLSKEAKRERIMTAVGICVVLAFTFVMMTDPAMAAGSYTSQIKNIMNNMVDIVGTIFQVVGVMLGVYSVGQIVLAFKNEDANSKTAATTQLVVGIVLIALPGIVKTLNLVNMIGS